MFEGISKRLSLSQLINLSLATFLLLGVAATTYTVTNLTNLQTEAAKGGSGGGGKGGGKNGGSFTGTCSVSPNPDTLGGAYSVYGTGFKANEVVSVNVTDQGGQQVLLTSADSSGNFNVGSYASYTGTYSVRVYDNVTTTYITSCSFTVQ